MFNQTVLVGLSSNKTGLIYSKYQTQLTINRFRAGNPVLFAIYAGVSIGFSLRQLVKSASGVRTSGCAGQQRG